MPNFPNICKIAQKAEGATTMCAPPRSGLFVELTSESAHMKNRKIIPDPMVVRPPGTDSSLDPRGATPEPPGV